MSYKRLTKYNEYTHNAEVYAYTVGNEDCYFDGMDIVGYENPNLAQETIERLALLEDKIENGTLIELGKPYIRQLSMIPQQDKYIICKATERVIAGAFTKAEVEAKLKELQGE